MKSRLDPEVAEAVQLAAIVALHKQLRSSLEVGGAEPCWCVGPWAEVDPADRPETTSGREHPTGSRGCEYLATDTVILRHKQPRSDA